MIIKYEFVTGEVEKVEVPDEIGEFIIASRREEKAEERRYYYHSAYSLDGTDFEEEEVVSERTPESDYILSEENRRLYDALDTLNDVQRRRLEMLADGMTYREIASLEGAKHNKIIKSVECARKNFLKNF